MSWTIYTKTKFNNTITDEEGVPQATNANYGDIQITNDHNLNPAAIGRRTRQQLIDAGIDATELPEEVGEATVEETTEYQDVFVCVRDLDTATKDAIVADNNYPVYLTVEENI